MSEKRYVIALKRERAADAPADWQKRLQEIEGVTVQGAARHRVQITADEETAGRVREELGDCCHVEEVAERSPL
jgi:hypothetical protein